MRLLCVGDIHLGRQPSRLTAAVTEGGISPRELSPSAAWRLTVKESLAREADAVLLVGDVVEQNDDFYEAYSDLRQGIEQLAKAGIQVLGVAGNHDVEVLPRLAAELPDFQLLGRDGQWEGVDIQGADGIEVRILGWSFPAQAVMSSPLELELPERGARNTLGLLHCDRDQTGSRYAPVRSADLEAAPVDAWLLGHIHKPDTLAGPRPIGYLGSLSGVGPGETGAHGPWLMDVASDGSLDIKQLPLAPLRWEEVDIRLDGLEEADEIHGMVVRALNDLHRRIVGVSHQPKAVGCRLHLVGRTTRRQEIEQSLKEADPREHVDERDGITYFVHDWRMAALPAIDLEELAQSNDPVGLLARKLVIIRGDESEARAQLIQEAQQRMASAVRGRYFTKVRADIPDEAETAAILEDSGLRALDALLAQQAAEP